MIEVRYQPAQGRKGERGIRDPECSSLNSEVTASLVGDEAPWR
jgi:hypothetical protein